MSIMAIFLLLVLFVCDCWAMTNNTGRFLHFLMASVSVFRKKQSSATNSLRLYVSNLSFLIIKMLLWQFSYTPRDLPDVFISLLQSIFSTFMCFSGSNKCWQQYCSWQERWAVNQCRFTSGGKSSERYWLNRRWRKDGSSETAWNGFFARLANDELYFADVEDDQNYNGGISRLLSMV